MTLGKKRDVIPEDAKLVELLINTLNILQKILEPLICLVVIVTMVQYDTQLQKIKTTRV